MQLIQFTCTGRNQADATAILNALLLQEGCVGGRTIGLKVQVFMEPGNLTSAAMLPDGCRLVEVPESQAQALGITRRPDNAH